MNEKPPRDILTGRRFGKLLVLEQWERRGVYSHIYWLCQCDCGSAPKMIGANSLKCGTQSCGCLLKAYQESLKDKPSQNKPKAARVIKEPKPKLDQYKARRYSLVSRSNGNTAIFDNESGLIVFSAYDEKTAREELKTMIHKELRPIDYIQQKSAADIVEELVGEEK